MKTLDKTAPKEDQSYKYITFAMCYIALASELMYVDGPANKVEIQSLANSFTNIQDNITELVILARSDSLSKEYYLGKIGKLFHNNPRILQDLMNNLVKIAISDGFITNKETEWLIEAGKFFGFLKSKIIDLIWYHIKSLRQNSKKELQFT